MLPDSRLPRRQIWAAATATTSAISHHCTPFELPSRGLLTIDNTSVITLTHNAVFHPECTGKPAYNQSDSGSNSQVTDLRDPFYASTLPQIYAIAAATVLSYMLFIIILITPRSFFVGGSGGGSGFLGQRGIISGASGSTSVVGVGSRPLLQKVAVLTVVISLTIATADTFKVAQRQYDAGYEDATALTAEVVGGLEIRIVRVISDTLLWLAQVQTLIRLFPRHKEKVIIKWTGFALIVLDTVFSILNTFVDDSGRWRPRTFVDAIPALSYLFELALSLLYAAWVIFYSLSKRKFAFFHPKMRNICLVAILALTTILIPVVFFVLDISKPNVVGWGDYVRWVGAAAASVVVWEWVERIEALERDDRKDGILGREIFDGDEMIEVTPSWEVDWPGSRQDHQGGGGGHAGISMSTGQGPWSDVANRSVRPRHPQHHSQGAPQNVGFNRSRAHEVVMTGALGPTTAPDPTPPPIVSSPVSRTDTTSAASTIYTVRYHPICGPTPPIEAVSDSGVRNHDNRESMTQPEQSLQDPSHSMANAAISSPTHQETSTSRELPKIQWRNVSNPFKRRRASPPREVTGIFPVGTQPPASRTISRGQVSTDVHRISRLNRLRPRRTPKALGSPLPLRIIPVQSPGRMWSPEILETLDGGDTEPTGTNIVPASLGSVPSEGPLRAIPPNETLQPLTSGQGGNPALPSQRDSLTIYGYNESSPPHASRLSPIISRDADDNAMSLQPSSSREIPNAPQQHESPEIRPPTVATSSVLQGASLPDGRDEDSRMLDGS
ncbi:pH-response regulator protein palH/rim21 [Toensbergia leucococca]|nr:pH-response regulator protein palH/rim21 [Toensbergia leucococca]